MNPALVPVGCCRPRRAGKRICPASMGSMSGQRKTQRWPQSRRQPQRIKRMTMMRPLSQLLALLGQEPVALWGDWLRAFAASGRMDDYQGFSPRGVHNLFMSSSVADAAEFKETQARVTPGQQRSVAMKSGAVAVIPVNGIITGKPTMWEQYGMTKSGGPLGSGPAAG